MQTPKPRTNSPGGHQRKSPRAASSETSKKDSPGVVRKLKTSPRYLDPTTSSTNQAARAPKESSPKVPERRPSKSVLSEKDPPDRIAELESQISRLEYDLKDVKAQLHSSEKSKEQALENAEESNRQLLALSEPLEDIQKKISEKSRFLEPDEQELQSKLEAFQKQHLLNLDELESLKVQLEVVVDTSSESAQIELLKLNKNLEEMKKQVEECKEFEDRAKELVGETLMQLEMAKKTVETLRADGNKVTEAYSAVSFELEKSRARVKFLEELVSNLKANDSVETELNLVRIEVEQLRSVVKVAETKYNKERVRTVEETRNAVEMVEQIKSASGQREAELEAELRKSKYEIEELKTNLMDKEEENDELMTRLENGVLEHELEKLKVEIEDMKDGLAGKETELQNASEENRVLKLEIEAAREVEREAVMKVGYMTEEVDKSNRKLARVTEQLEAEQAAYAELEGELRKMKVQSDQWRKAAEAATAMLSAGNNEHLIERTGSMDSRYCPRTRRVSVPYGDEFDEELFKKKNGNVLTRFGVLWKKPQK